MKRVFFAMLMFASAQGIAQYSTDKVVGKKQEVLIDNLKQAEYPHIFPFWGEKVVKRGIQMPKSGGLSVQYLWQSSEILVNNLRVGFNNGPTYSLDQLVRFDKAVASSQGVNIRPDLWVLPFLNVYGILAKSKTSTTIDAGIWLPDVDSNWSKVASFNTKAEFNATTYGFGITPTAGVAGFFLALDFNCTWSDIAELSKPAFIFNIDPRLGKNFSFKKKDMSLATWVGAFRVHMNSGTSGSMNMSDLFPTDEWAQKIDNTYDNVQVKQQQVDNWWDGLTPIEQKNPINIAKHNAANAALDRMGQVLNNASEILTNGGTTVQYSLEKKQKNMWNFLLGAQFQLNRDLMFRAEYGFLGSRQQFIGGIQYRFDF